MTAPAPKRRWFLYWVLVFGVLAFAVPEAIALFDPDQGDTLSESLRWLTGGPLGAVAFVGFLVWFGWHILYRRRRPDVQ